MNITVLGGGAWGTALAVQLNRSGNKVVIWEYFADQVEKMLQTRVSDNLPGVRIPEDIVITADLACALQDAESVFVVVPSRAFKQTLISASASFDQVKTMVICSKGFTPEQELFSRVADEYFSGEIYCLYGPNLAGEVARGELSAAILAGTGDLKGELINAVQSENFRIESGDDIIGVQVASALKNVVTIFIGILQGSGAGENTCSYYFVKGLQEIERIGLALGGKTESFYSLTGLGDLLLTSRNRQLGIEIGKGRSPEEVLASKTYVAEGVVAIKNALIIARSHSLQVPIIEALYGILFEGADIKATFANLHL